MKFRDHIFLCLFLLLTTQSTVSQSINAHNPYINNFTKKDYKGGIENWDASSIKTGYMYFANNEGLLKFDGYKWSLFKLPNKTIVRSIASDTINHRIYAGGQDEVGYFSLNIEGKLVFTSIKHLLPKKFSSIEDVWDISVINKKVMFRSVNKIFVYEQGKIEVLETTSKNINSLNFSEGKIYFGDPNNGIFEIINNKGSFVKGSELFIGQKLVGIINITKSKKLFISERNGIYEYNGQTFIEFGSNQDLSNKILSTAIVIDKNLIAVGSVLQGILFLDTLGHIKHNITKKKGLQTNAIIALIKDGNGNLWAGTTNGIDQILVNSPYSVFYPDGELQGGAYAIKLYKNKLYVGTTNGLYYTNWTYPGMNDSTPFYKVQNSDGQVWSLDIIGDDLLMGHNEGAFQIIDNIAVKISKDYIGTWRFINLPDPNYMVTGTYNGLQLFKQNNGRWEFVQNIKGFNESSRIITKDINDHLWLSHPYRGVYKLTLSDDFKSVSNLSKYGKDQGLPTNLSNYIVRLKDNIYVNGEIGIHKYIPKEDKFIEDKNLTQLIGNQINIRRLFQDNEESIWYVNEKDCGVLVVNNSVIEKKVEKNSVSFINGKLIGGFENIYAPNDSTVFACTDKGVVLIDYLKLKMKHNLTIYFTEIEFGLTNKEVIHVDQTNQKTEESNIDYNQNSIKFSFATNQLDPTSQVKYSFMIKGYNEEWSEWSDQNFHEINNLNPGNYTFIVKAIAAFGAKTNEIQYNFTIKNPWYNSFLAKVVYLLFIALGLWFLINYINKSHEKDKMQLKQEKEMSEAKIKILEHEKLQAEIEFKNRELALSTMHVLQKNETIAKLKEELNVTVKQSQESETKNNIKKIIGILSDDSRLEEDWESFAIHFDIVHSDFLKRLKSNFPQLSPKDLKMCAYLRMNMSTKDLAPLLKISVRGVEISRYRLRKKMNIHPDTNLNDFMMKF